MTCLPPHSKRKRGSEIVADMIVDLVAQMAVEGLEPWLRKDVRR